MLREFEVYTKFDEGPTTPQPCSPYDTVANFLLSLKVDTDTCKVTLCGDRILPGDRRPMYKLNTTFDKPLWIRALREFEIYTKLDERPTIPQLCSPYYDTVANFLLSMKVDTDTCKVTLCGDCIIPSDRRPMNELNTTFDKPLWIREFKVYTKFDEGPTTPQPCSSYDTVANFC